MGPNDGRTGTGGTDDELVARVRAGDDVAFEAIYDRYAPGVLAFCVHMLSDREGAKDALQLTFVSAYRALRAGDSRISLRPWLYAIARNRCLSELRAREESVSVHDPVTDRRYFDPADALRRREDFREMVDDMHRLPADQRAALVLFELGGQSHAEIAAVLGVRREKVKALIFQAREGLVRGRYARNSSCAAARELIANVRGKILPRSRTRAHIERCPGCAAFEDEVRSQRSVLALVLPVVAAAELKASVLMSALGAGGAARAVGAAGAAGGAGAAGLVAAIGGGGVAGGAGARVARSRVARSRVARSPLGGRLQLWPPMRSPPAEGLRRLVAWPCKVRPASWQSSRSLSC